MKNRLNAALACLFCLMLMGCTATFDIDAPMPAYTAPSATQPHQHTWMGANCTTPRFCKTCGETEGEAAGHRWSEATCTAPAACWICGEIKAEPTGHAWMNAICAKPQMCRLCKEIAGNALGHAWRDATCLEPMTCEVCGKTEGEAAGHLWLDAACTAPKTCEACGETEGEATGHTWKDATCTAPKTCEACGETEGEATGHSWKSATCTKPKTCKICWETKGEANGHSWKSATCTKPKTCETCGKTDGEPKGHDYQNGACSRCGNPAPSTPAPGGTTGEAIVATAMNYIGVPYVWGGESPAGFDCSGYVQYVFNIHNIWLPRNSSQQYQMGTTVSKSNLQPGDLVFFGTSGVSHVGIYVGEGQFIHCSSSRGVIISELDSSYWSIRYIGAKRVI